MVMLKYFFLLFFLIISNVALAEKSLVALACPEPNVLEFSKSNTSCSFTKYAVRGRVIGSKHPIFVSGCSDVSQFTGLHAASYNYDGDSHSFDCLYQMGMNRGAVLYTLQLSEFFGNCHFAGSRGSVCEGASDQCVLLCEKKTYSE